LGPHASKSALVPHAPTNISKRSGGKNLSIDENNNEEEESKRTGKSVTDMMKDSHMVQRYSQYLNKCMFIASDPFMKKKYQ
jgi:hypothetical protein